VRIRQPHEEAYDLINISAIALRRAAEIAAGGRTSQMQLRSGTGSVVTRHGHVRNLPYVRQVKERARLEPPPRGGGHAPDPERPAKKSAGWRAKARMAAIPEPGPLPERAAPPVTDVVSRDLARLMTAWDNSCEQARVQFLAVFRPLSVVAA
jgi:hypothetical protein